MNARRPQSAATAVTAMFVALGGCAGQGGTVSSPLETIAPQDWKEWETPDPAETLSWSTFGDPGLESLLEVGLDGNLSIDSAAMLLESAKLDVVRNRENIRPGVGIASSYLESGSIGDGSSGLWNASVSGSYRIELSGNLARQVDLAELNVESNRLSLKAIRIDTAASIARAYFRIRALDEQIALSERSIEKAAAQKRLVEARVKVGRAIRVDVDRQNILMSGLEEQIENSKATRVDTVHGLAVLLGLVPETIEFKPTNLELDPAPVLKPGLPLDTLRGRPDIELAEVALASSNIRAELVRRRYYPSLDLSVAATSVSTSARDLFDTVSKPWDALLAATYPLFDAGAYRAELEQLRLDQQLALNDYEQTVLGALRDVETALSNQESVLRQQRILAEEQAAQQRVSTETQAKYRAGRVSALDLVIDENALIEVERRQVDAWLRAQFAAIDLLRALGIEPTT